jgi:thymidylate synthase
LKEDFKERVQSWINPGLAWRIRPWVWEEYLKDNKFEYTYSERINYKDIIKEIKAHPTSRQYVLNIWDRSDRFNLNGKQRIPCSLNYQILIRPNWELDENNQPIQCVNMIYNMRSCDYLTHFPIDIIQATNLLKLITSEIWNNYQIGKLYYNCASLHLYRKDLIEDVF